MQYYGFDYYLDLEYYSAAYINNPMLNERVFVFISVILVWPYWCSLKKLLIDK